MRWLSSFIVEDDQHRQSSRNSRCVLVASGTVSVGCFCRHIAQPRAHAASKISEPGESTPSPNHSTRRSLLYYAPSMDWKPLQQYWSYAVAFAALLAVVAAMLTNIRSIVAVYRDVLNGVRRTPPDEPVLIAFRKTPDPQAEDESTPDSRPTKFDITISYEGRDKLLFNRIEIRHWPGRLLTFLETGALRSKGAYTFHYRYNSLTKADLIPPMVLEPAAESILNFTITLIPDSSSGQARCHAWRSRRCCCRSRAAHRSRSA
jgi:hypothetical protein